MNAASANRGWQVWIDRGGTFTDLVALAPDGRLLTRKLLSEDPRHYADAASHGIRELLEREDPQGRIDAIRMGTTLATNALLEHRGARTGLVITRGFADALAIGYQNRPHLFRRRIDLPEPLYSAVVEADERLAADGRVLRPLAEDRLAAELARLREAGIESLAIVFLHAYVNPAHEQLAAVLARAAGFLEVSASHAVSPLIRLVARGDTTVADAYLTPLLAGYLQRFRDSLGARHAGTRLYLMQSSGVLAEATAFRGANAVLSGPAGGLVGLARASVACGRSRLVGFDMGGTSTDVALYDGELPRRFTSLVAGVRLQTPMMDIHTVAAGGGSLLRAAHGRLLVGPESAGAHPGPACYRNGGPLTVTDLNVFLGRIPATHFPRVFGPGGDQPLDAAAARLGFVSLARELRCGAGEPYTPERLAEGFLEVAVEQMANAIRHVSTRQGQDAADYTLFCFGGAAGQHACRVAAALGMRAALIHPLAGVLSAWGIGLADQGVLKRRSFERPFAQPSLAEAATALAQLAADAAAELVSQGAPAAGIATQLHAELRAAGTETDFAIAMADYETMAAAFLQAFQTRFGYAADPTQVTLAALRAEAVFAGPRPAAVTGDAPAAHSPAPGGLVRAWFGGWSDVPLFDRQALQPGAVLAGPAIVAEQHATTVVEPGWQASVLPGGELLLAHVAAAPRVAADATAADPVLLELFNHRFMHVAEQMGAVLQNTAVSVNIRERLDFSCAVFDAAGALIANAPHMPVHLGSMGASVRAVIDRSRGRLRPGDAWLLNAPYAGGTHLPDITVVSPVYLAGSAAPDFFVASRAHHADIGGRTPGSMPPASTQLCEEGIVFDGFQVVAGGRLLEAELRERLSQGPWPARNPDQNVADIQAQLAANQRGASELTALAGRAGAAVVRAYLRHVQDNAELAVREAIAGLGSGSFCYELDSGAVIRVRVAVDAASRSAEIDFTGTSAQLADNFNAPRAVCTAAVLYVFRTLVESDLPLNEGCLRPLSIIVPAGSMLAPDRQAAVVAGNVETSQCVVDALYGALGVLAASQGTMNNLTFGNDRHQYYETIAGGAGAGPGFDGASGVQTHMTNSRLTDPEVLELRFPVRLREFHYRRGSGGAGRWRGGDGLVRAIQFLEPMEVGILANRRRVPPFGLAGGLPGATGSARIERADGRVEPLAATDSARVLPGDAIVVETPGGGGFGTPAV